MIFRFRMSFPCSHWNVSLMICGECTVDAYSILEACSMWKLCPKSGSHTHTHTLHHQPLKTIHNIDSITINSIYHRWSFKNFLQTSPTPRNHSKFPWLPRIAWNWVSQLPVSVFRLLYKPYQPATRLGFSVLQSMAEFWGIHRCCSCKRFRKTKNSNIIKSIMFTIHKCIEMQHDNFFHVWNTSQIYHKLSKSGMYVGKCSPTLKAM